LGGGLETIRQLQGLRYTELMELEGYAIYAEARVQMQDIISTVILYLPAEKRCEIIGGILEKLKAIENPREIAEREAFEAELRKLNMRILAGGG